MSESHSVVSDSLRSHRQYSPWNSPGHNTRVGSTSPGYILPCRRISLLQGIFPTQESNPGLLHYRRILYQLNHKGSPPTRQMVIKKSIKRKRQTGQNKSHCFSWTSDCKSKFLKFSQYFKKYKNDY